MSALAELSADLDLTQYEDRATLRARIEAAYAEIVNTHCDREEHR